MNASAMLPIVRVLAVSAFAATSDLVRPLARTAWYSCENFSARTKSHHETFSH